MHPKRIGSLSKIGCVLDLPFRYLDGDSFMDRSVFGHLCTNYGSKWQLDGRYFDGANYYVDAGSASSLKLAGDFTIEAGVKFAPASMGIHKTIVDYYYTRGYCLHKADTNQVKVYRAATGLIGTRVLVADVSYRITASMDAGKSTGYIYIDGLFDKSGTLDVTPDFPGGSLLIGKRHDGYHLQGLIPKVCIYSFADYVPRILSRSIGG